MKIIIHAFCDNEVPNGKSVLGKCYYFIIKLFYFLGYCICCAPAIGLTSQLSIAFLPFGLYICVGAWLILCLYFVKLFYDRYKIGYFDLDILIVVSVIVYSLRFVMRMY